MLFGGVTVAHQTGDRAVPGSTLTRCTANNLGQVVHTSIKQYNLVPALPPRMQQQYMGEVWPTTHIAELCLYSLPAQDLGNGDEQHP